MMVGVELPEASGLVREIVLMCEVEEGVLLTMMVVPLTVAVMPAEGVPPVVSLMPWFSCSQNKILYCFSLLYES
jgi:hypothetical protein